MIAQTMIRRWALAATAAACAALAGCESTSSLFQSDKIDYKSAKQGPTLEVPPDLTQLSQQQTYTVPGGAVSAVAQQAQGQSQQNAASATALNQIGDIRMDRDGNQRWLVVVNRTPEQLWPVLRDFWQDNGFLLALDEPKLGIMETDWAENRAKLPQDIIRSTIGKLFDGIYSTGERDKFRTRVERTATGTEIYISHRGLVEVYSDTQKTQTIWQPRPSDPELETEFLRRLMVQLGVPQEKSRQVVQQTANVGIRAEAVQVAGQPAMRLSEGMDNAWRRVGLSLDRTGFTVENRDQPHGIYEVRYVDPVADTKANEPGIFSRFFKRNNQPTPVRYHIKLAASGDATVVSVLDEHGAPAKAEDAQRIVNVLVNDLK